MNKENTQRLFVTQWLALLPAVLSKAVRVTRTASVPIPFHGNVARFPVSAVSLDGRNRKGGGEIIKSVDALTRYGVTRESCLQTQRCY